MTTAAPVAVSSSRSSTSTASATVSQREGSPSRHLLRGSTKRTTMNRLGTLMRPAPRSGKLPPWLPWAVAVLAVAVAAGGWLIGRYAQDADQRAGQLATGLGVAVEQRDATAEQAVDLAVLIAGACRTGEIPPQYEAACEQAAQVQAAPVPPVDGADGLDGRPGRDGRDGANGLTPPCFFEPSQCQGQDGADGAPGRDGVDGQDGADGQDGQDGVDGRDGLPGCDFGESRATPDGPCEPDPPMTEPTSMPLSFLRFGLGR